MNSGHAFPVRVIVVMGVAGAGKTTVGRALAHALGWQFFEADEFHSAANVAKMGRGQPLTDDDRAPWLAELCALIAGIVRSGADGVLACSALKQSYRDALVPRDTPPGTVRFVHLDVPESELRARLEHRRHFFGPELLDSQLATLEIPPDAIRVDGSRPVDDIVRSILESIER